MQRSVPPGPRRMMDPMSTVERQGAHWLEGLGDMVAPQVQHGMRDVVRPDAIDMMLDDVVR